jgi:tetratricopeptide (TPR) repeat protein
MLGTILRQQGHTQEALGEFRQTIQLQPRSAEAYLSLGQLLHRTGDEAGSTAALNQAERLNKLKANEQAAAFALNRGVEKLGTGDVDGAIGDLTEAVRLAPELPRAHYQLALALRQRGAHAKAREHFAEAQRLAPYLEIPPFKRDE